MLLLLSADFFQNYIISKISLRYTISVSNGLDSDQYQCSFGPDLDPNCLQILSADKVLSGLIQVQTVCQDHQPTTLGDKELT